MNSNLWDSHINVELEPCDLAYHGCDICRKQGDSLVENEPWYANSFTDKDVCSNCYPKFYDLCKPITRDDSYKICDVCVQDIRDTSYFRISENNNNDMYSGISVCIKCYEAKKPFGLNANQPCIPNDRDTIIIAKHLTASDYVVPAELVNEVTVERNECFIDLLNSAVRLPDSYDNILEWTLITDMQENGIHSDACYGIAMNCVKFPHAIASIIEDNHGRVAMNIIYNDYRMYLKERSEYEPEKMKLTASNEYACEYSSDEEVTEEWDAELNKLKNEYTTCFSGPVELGSEEHKQIQAKQQLILEKINKLKIENPHKPKTYVYKYFEEYIRRKNNLSFYYG